jgi:flagellar motor switch protein FliN/FliY
MSSPRSAGARSASAARATLCIVLGRTRLARDEARQLDADSMVELDQQAEEPVDIVVDGRLFARGQLIVVDGKLCVRVCELVAALQAA